LTRTERLFSLLNVRSAGSSSEADLTARARIRDAAVRRFAGEGFGVPVRAIAAEAGVSPGLVIHHFGSKDALRAECDDHVLQLIRDAKSGALAGPGPRDLLAELASVEEYAAPVGYLVQALLVGGALADAFLDHLVADAEKYVQEAVEAGTLRPSRDPAARARFLVYLGVGALLVHLRRHPPQPGGLGAAVRGYTEFIALPALELYTDGLLTSDDWLQQYLSTRPDLRGTP
jgi:AcrR family transcriptional regulator